MVQVQNRQLQGQKEVPECLHERFPALPHARAMSAPDVLDDRYRRGARYGVPQERLFWVRGLGCRAWGVGLKV